MIGVSLTLYLTLYALLITAYVSVVFYLARSADEPANAIGTTSNSLEKRP